MTEGLLEEWHDNRIEVVDGVAQEGDSAEGADDGAEAISGYAHT